MITTNKLVDVLHGNCINIVPTLGKFNFIFADPPFDIGQKYNGYHDKRKYPSSPSDGLKPAGRRAMASWHCTGRMTWPRRI
jgi:hypothetical protein